MNKQQKGFTLIELVMVIVILGILSAFAFPKFANLSGNARKASLEGALGSIKSSSAIVHAKALVINQTTGALTLEGTALNLVNSYPDSETIDLAAQLSATDYTIVDTSGTVVTVTLGSCSFTYTEAAVANSAPTISTLTNTGPDANEC